MKAPAVRALPLLVVLGVGSPAGMAACADPRSAESQASATSTTTSPATPTTSPGPSSPTPSTAPSTDAPRPQEIPTTDESLIAGRYQPLWPFTGPGEVAAWRRAYQQDGRAPWHLDARRTAIAFTRDYLGFTEIDQAVKTVQEGEHARVHVGFRPEDGGKPLVAAVVHLMRYGAGKDAPWEVVGTDDTSLSLTDPPYGASVTSPMTVGGRVTGVDESIRIQVRHPGSPDPLGEQCCVGAGGENTPWKGQVTFSAEPGRTLTVVASTGGHVAAVERFAITGVSLPS